MSTDEYDEDWYESLLINKKPVQVKLDAGAQCDIISKSMFDSLNLKNKEQSKSKVKLMSFFEEKRFQLG
ncbi:Hypothetical predicted protein [Octopus vulgaris]|uniref:Uncharacterized protein n=1 Tax=Octopus vulgaris TaxID=6645 RepID=A0AA36F831_OCTVU|nr:Hypothetical predicted protein [Octopus vulgaris]